MDLFFMKTFLHGMLKIHQIGLDRCKHWDYYTAVHNCSSMGNEYIIVRPDPQNNFKEKYVEIKRAQKKDLVE